MLKKSENNEMEEIGLVTLTPGVLWNVITLPCPNFNIDFTEPLLGHGWVENLSPL